MDSSSSRLEKDDTLLQIRDKLRKDNVKLWLQPYYNELTGCSEADLKALADAYSASLRLPFDDSIGALRELQSNSLENLKQSNNFKTSGVATLKIKVLAPNGPTRVLVKELLLSLRGEDIKELVTKELGIAKNKLKLIHCGKVLNDSDNLGSQGVKNGNQILAITLTDSTAQMKETEDRIRELEDVKTDSSLLALDTDYMNLEDQFGNIVKIPMEEKRALIVAMALHEKGKTALKREDFSRALVFFLEADVEFRRCNAQILNSVDNYALLDLDIAWCYLCLQSIVNLPEAYERLKRCEDRFKISYGANLERVLELKGTVGNEAVLLMRLHLLQAIALYHKNKRKEAIDLLRKAQQELTGLKVDENSILTLVELGYSTAEARLGLRATGGEVNRALNYIEENRKKRMETRKKAVAEEILQKKREKLGFCNDGTQYVNPNFVNILVNMGYNHEVACVALRNTNNIISDSIQYIQDHPQAGPSHSKSFEFTALINDLVPELAAAGFDTTMCKRALEKHEGNITKAAEDLLEHQGIIEANAPIVNGAFNLLGIPSLTQDDAKKEAFKRIAGDISMVDDDHLDITLVQEENFLTQYLSLLDKNQ